MFLVHFVAVFQQPNILRSLAQSKTLEMLFLSETVATAGIFLQLIKFFSQIGHIMC